MALQQVFLGQNDSTSQNLSTPSESSDTESTIIAKLLSMALLGLSSLFMILLPIVLTTSLHRAKRDIAKHGTRTENILSLFLSFGGGVLLSTTFLHLLPEVHEGVENLQNVGKLPSDLPIALPELIMCLGFFTMYVVEEAVHSYLHSQTHRRHPKKFDIEMGPEVTVIDCSDTNRGLSKGSAKITLIDAELIPPEEFDDDRRGSFRQTHIDTTFPPVADDKVYAETVKISQSAVKTYGANAEESPSHDEHNHFGHEHVPTLENPVLFRELLIVIALTVHEVFEGLAIGLEVHLASVWYLFTAVAIHKSVIAFCIGVEMVSAKTKLSLAIVYALIFSVASPIGIGIGLLLDSGTASVDVMEILSVVLQGMATGTLLYVVFFEVLKREPGRNNGGLPQMVAILVGFTVMAGLQTWLA